MRRQLLALLTIALVAQGGSLRLKRVALVPAGPWADGFVVCYDTDHDGEGEFIFSNGGLGGYQCWSVCEYRPANRYDVVYSDTAPIEWPPGVVSTGRFWPFDAGDVDGDGKTDLAGQVFYIDSLDSLRKTVCTIEARDGSSHPDTLNWHVTLQFPASGIEPIGITDLDRDGRMELLEPARSTWVWENVADDRESLVYDSPPSNTDRYPVADFDGNGRTDYACNWDGKVRIMECAGDNRYVQVCSISVVLVNASDIFSGNDVDRNGRPEFFTVEGIYRGLGWKLFLTMFEATAEHQYAFWRLDSEDLGLGAEPAPKVSLCADLDGDSVEEVIWSCCTHIYVLRATGPHQFRRECLWMNDHGVASLCNAWDMNGNGYKEVLVGGCGWTSVLEAEPVRIMYPYRKRALVSGDTCTIRWRIYTPPRCDSVSLFLWTDTTVHAGERFWRLDTIATGLAPTESSYAWVVPDTTLSWAKILAIAYGPGWQFDDSDSAFRIAPQGVGAEPEPILTWSLSLQSVAGRGSGRVSYTVPQATPLTLGLYDAGGRMTATLAQGTMRPGRYTTRLPDGLPAGVWFIRLDAPGINATKKAVVVR